MFAKIAPRYDFLNHFLSFQTDRLWRKRTARSFAPFSSAPTPVSSISAAAPATSRSPSHGKAKPVDRARVLGAAFRVASLISAGMSGVLGRTSLVLEGGRLVLTLPAVLGSLAGERLMSRMKTLGRLLGREPLFRVLPG